MWTLNFSLQKDSALLLLLLLFFSLKAQVAMQFTAETRGVLGMQNFIPSYMKGWTYVRTDGRTILSEPKCLGCIDNQTFLPTCSAARERASLKIGRKNKASAFFFFFNWDSTQRTPNPALPPKREHDSSNVTNFIQPKIPKAIVVLRS